MFHHSIKRFDDTKRTSSLTLFAYRGSANHRFFVEALNQIDVVFHEVPDILESWHKYYNDLNMDIQETEVRRNAWKLMRVDLLSKIANHLLHEMLLDFYENNQLIQNPEARRIDIMAN